MVKLVFEKDGGMKLYYKIVSRVVLVLLELMLVRAMEVAFVKKTVLHSFRETKCLHGLLQDWQLDIKAWKGDCKNCVNGLLVANASSQSIGPSSITLDKKI